MSDNDTQDISTNDETIELSNENVFDEPTSTKEVTPEPEPAAEPKAEEPVETPAEEDKPDAEPTPQDAPEDPNADEAIEEKSEFDLKQLSKEERREYFQNLQRQAAKEVEQAVDQAYQPQPLDALAEHYMQQGYDEGTATVLARDDVRTQREQIAEAKAEIAELNSTLRTEAYDVMHSIDWLNPGNKETFDKDSFEAAGKLYEQMVVTDPRTGQIVDAKMTPKQFYTLMDKIRNAGSSKAQLAAQKAAERQMAAAAAPTSTAPPASQQSPDDKQASSLERALNQAV